MDNNIVLVGEVVQDFIYSHSSYGENFYTIKVKTKRLSGAEDILNCICSDRVWNINNNLIGKRVKINGMIKSFNEKNGDKIHLLINVYILNIGLSDLPDIDEAALEGVLCKRNFRRTPSGKKLSDVILAVNRSYGKTDYIPVLCWGKNAEYVSDLDIGTKLYFTGRLQSRYYLKNNDYNIAYEFSSNSIVVLE